MTRSSSMNHIIEKTNENILPVKKFSHLLHPKTDIFNRQQFKDDSKNGKRNISMEIIRNNEDYSGKRDKDMNEVHFINLYKDR